VGQCWDNYFSSKVLILLVLLVKINKSSQVPRKRVSKKHHNYKSMTNDYLQKYKNHLITKGYNAETSHTRTGQVNEFLEFTKLEINKIGELEIIKYYNYLKKRPNKRTGKLLNPNTILHHIRAIELFFIMLFDTGELDEIPEINIKSPKDFESDFVREIVSQEEIQKLYKKANLLETIILHLGYGCGLRVAELVAVTKHDIYLKESFLIVPKGKFNKRRIVPLTEKISNDLGDYLQEISKQETFIINSKNRKMQEWTFNKILKILLKKIQIPEERIYKISIHSLRHSIATHLLENGMELEKVRDFLGHNQLETTQTYTHISMNQLINLKNDSS
jgi:integrase/recombinase XerD